MAKDWQSRDSIILEKLRTIDNQVRKIKELIQKIEDSGHPHAAFIVAALKENGFENFSSAEDCFMPESDKWITDGPGFKYIGRHYGRD